jgi:hypothetical protein
LDSVPANGGESSTFINKDKLTGANGYRLFMGQDKSIKQEAYIKSLSSKKIEFHIFVSNDLEKKTSTIQGVAIDKFDGDPEMDLDEHGEMYPAEEYFYEAKGCLLAIRIDILQKDKLRIIESGCEARHDKAAPFESIGVLRIKP